MKRVFLLVTSVLLFETATAQVVEDFDDGDFEDGSPLTWSVSQSSGNNDFAIVGGEVQSDGPSSSSGDIHLSTNFGIDFLNNDIVWTFKARYTGGAPSNSNRIEIYLMSDIEDVTGTPQGYYIGMGETGSGDGIDFFKSNSGTALITDGGDLVGSGIDVHIRVTRTSDGMWTLEADPTGGDTFVTIGTVTDTEFTSGDFFAFYVQHTSTRFDDFFFDDVTLTFTPVVDMDPPLIQSLEAISATQVDVAFNEDVDQTTAENASNYSLDGGVSVSSAQRDAVDNSIVHLTTTALVNGQSYNVTVNNVEDLNSNVVATNTQAMFEYLITEEAEAEDVVINEFHASPGSGSAIPDAEFIELFNRSSKFIELENWTFSDESGTSGSFSPFVLRPDSFLVLTDVGDGALFNTYGDVLEVSGFRALNNEGDSIIIRNSSGTIIHEIYYTESTTEISTELINPNGPDYSENNYGLSIDPAGGTPGRQNSIFDDTPDTTPPTISGLIIRSVTRIDVSFSEEVEEATAGIESNYMLDGGISVVSAQLGTDNRSMVELTISALTAGVTYTLTVNNLEDLSGNPIASDSQISFGLGRTAQFNELIITEIMFDPDPAVGLPEAEYLELFNSTTDLIDVEGVFFADGTSTVAMPNITLSPRSYTVFTTRVAASEFQGMNVVGVPSLPSLNNSGEQLTLFSAEDLIFSIQYDPAWHDGQKEEGGYSLEMKDVTNPCSEEVNWGSSVDPSGGTPGRENSLNEAIPDNFGPQVLLAVAISPDTVRIDFDERLHPQVQDLANAAFEPNLPVAGYVYDIQRPKSLFVILAETLTEGALHNVSIDGVTDCSGNEVQDHDITFTLPSAAEPGEILLSEVLFNPRTDGVDFIELYNNSDRFLSLKNWQLARITEEGVDDEELISAEELVFNPRAFLAITTDSQVLLGDYPRGDVNHFREITSLPTYANDTGNVVLLNETGALQELFHYEEDFHYNLLESPDGVSLERVSYDSKTNDSNNWRSASSTVGFATPGYANSQLFASDVSRGRVTADPKVFVPGNSGSGRDFTTINYEFDRPGKFANVAIYDQSGRLVKTLAEGALLATSGFLRWDGTSNTGELARLGYYIVLFEVYDSTGDSEVIKETVVVGRDF